MLAEIQESEEEKTQTKPVQWTFKASNVRIIKNFVRNKTSFTKESEWAQYILMQEIERQLNAK